MISPNIRLPQITVFHNVQIAIIFSQLCIIYAKEPASRRISYVNVAQFYKNVTDVTLISHANYFFCSDKKPRILVDLGLFRSLISSFQKQDVLDFFFAQSCCIQINSFHPRYCRFHRMPVCLHLLPGLRSSHRMFFPDHPSARKQCLFGKVMCLYTAFTR